MSLQPPATHLHILIHYILFDFKTFIIIYHFNPPPPTFVYLFTVSYICVCSRSLLFFLIYLINITAISIQSFFFYNTAGYPPVTDYRASRASMQ